MPINGVFAFFIHIYLRDIELLIVRSFICLEKNYFHPFIIQIFKNKKQNDIFIIKKNVN